MSLGQTQVNSAAVAGPAEVKAADPVAVVCGGGSLPATVADALIAQGRGVVMFPLYGWADPAEVRASAIIGSTSVSLGAFRGWRTVRGAATWL